MTCEAKERTMDGITIKVIVEKLLRNCAFKAQQSCAECVGWDLFNRRQEMVTSIS